jgi:transcriptional regulator GlxA family with amidase domain
MEFGVVAVPGGFDSGLTGVLDVLRWAEFLRPGVGPDVPPLQTTVLTLGDGPVRTAGGLTVPSDERLDAAVLRRLDVLVVPGLGIASEAAVSEVLQRHDIRQLTEFLRNEPPPGLRLAAACTGVFVLAEAGILDGLRATTTWWLADGFRRRYPDVELDMDVMVIRSGSVVTAGAAMAHLDLALDLVLEVSPQLARTTADMLLVDIRPARSIVGATHYLARTDDLVMAFEVYVRTNLENPFTIDDAAAAIGTTRKTLERHTRECAGLSPHDMLQRLRIERAVHLRRVTDLSMDQVARRVGYRNASTLRTLLRNGSRRVG